MSGKEGSQRIPRFTVSRGVTFQVSCPYKPKHVLAALLPIWRSLGKGRKISAQEIGQPETVICPLNVSCPRSYEFE